MKLKLTVLLLALWSVKTLAQSPTDGLLMQKRQWCNVLQYTNSSWSEYWEGTNKRSNLNLGTVTNQSVLLMSAYGITNKLNVMAALPWIRTGSSASYLQGQSGIQDFALWLKWQAYEIKMGSSALKFQTTGGVSVPASQYQTDFLPFSIGLKCKMASLRGIVHFTTAKGWYATAQAGHSWRSDVKIDRDAYIYNNQLIYGNRVPTPNFFDATLRLGILRPKFQAELWAERGACLSGDDIRYNEGPMLTNKMQATSTGAWAKYWITRQFAVSAGGAYVLQGRNVGQSTAINGGIFYMFTL